MHVLLAEIHWKPGASGIKVLCSSYVRNFLCTVEVAGSPESAPTWGRTGSLGKKLTSYFVVHELLSFGLNTQVFKKERRS